MTVGNSSAPHLGQHPTNEIRLVIKVQVVSPHHDCHVLPFGRNINNLEVRHLMDLQFSPFQHLNSQKPTNMTKTLPLGGQQVPVPGFGAMGLNSAMGSDLNLEQSEPVLLKAIELGCTFWDTAVSRSFRIL